MTTRNRAITALLALIAMLLLSACGPAPLTQEEAHRQCQADPKCHPAPSWVIEQRQGK
jgi:outer membrane biogenesis lipoprotein LolB